METEKLYYKEPLCREFTGRVLACDARGEHFAVELDRTAFYPEGGGQGWDLGTLGGRKVLAVTEEKGRIVHLCGGPLPAGQVVSGSVDWERRLELSRRHSGEHIFSGLVCGSFGCRNVGFHMGAEAITIDFDKPLTPDQVQKAEDEANEAVRRDLPIRCWFPEPGELSGLDYRSKKALEGPVRLVEIPGVDLCACCGTHVERTGQVGPIKVIGQEKFHGGTRLELLCGVQAWQYLTEVFRQNRQVSRLLSAKPLETGQAARRLMEEQERLKYRLVGLEREALLRQAEALRGKGDSLLVCRDQGAESLRLLACRGAEACGGLCLVLGGPDGAVSYALASEKEDVRPMAKAMNEALGGRGGGKKELCQGRLGASEAEIRAFWEKIPRNG